MQTFKGTSLNRSIRQATAVFALFVAYAASAAETQQAFANGQTLTGDLVLRAAEVGDLATFRADGSFLMPAVDVARGEWPVGFFFGSDGPPAAGRGEEGRGLCRAGRRRTDLPAAGERSRSRIRERAVQLPQSGRDGDGEFA